MLSSQKQLGINLQAASTVIESHPAARGRAHSDSCAHARAYTYVLVRPGALVSPHVREKVVEQV